MMKPIERFGPGWRSFSSALVAMKDTDALFFENPNELNVYHGKYPNAKITARAKLDSIGWATFRSVPSNLWLGSFTIFDSPQQMARNIERYAARKTDLSVEQWTQAANIVKECRDDLARALGEEILFCEIEAAGRIGSPLAEISLLASDIWNFVEVIDWRRGVVRISENDIIYSVHLRQNENKIQLSEHKNSSGKIGMRRAVYELLRVLDIGTLSTLTAKELMTEIEDKWKAHYPLKKLPSSDTVQRAREEVIKNRLDATHA